VCLLAFVFTDSREERADEAVVVLFVELVLLLLFEMLYPLLLLLSADE
jgi:hypothetical protein